jgi:DNA-binding transcriptional ArsR family regulator
VPYEDVLAALAHPTRRKLFEQIRQRPHTVGELAVSMCISQPGVSQHLQVLRRANLVCERREGVRHYYSPSPDGLAELRRYVESLWDDVLQAYAQAEIPPKTPREP